MKNLMFMTLAVFSACTANDRQPDVSKFIAGANQAFQNRDYSTALALADSALAHNRTSSDAYFMHGRIYFELQQWANAETAYLKVTDLEPDYPGVRHNLGNVYYHQRQYRRALAQFIHAAENNPAPVSWHAAGETYNALNQPDSAIAAFRKAVRLDSLYGPVYSSIAELFEKQGQYSEALKYSLTALRIRSGHLPDQLRQARLLLRLGRSNEAIALLRPLITEYSHLAEPRYILGQALQKSGFMEQSLVFLSEADSLRMVEQRLGLLANTAEGQPDHFQAQVDYAIALRQAGQLEKALSRYLIAQALRPANMSLQFHIATLETTLSDFVQAEERLLRILNTDSTHVLAWLGLENIYSVTERPDLARDALGQAVRINPAHPAVQEIVQRSRFP